MCIFNTIFPSVELLTFSGIVACCHVFVFVNFFNHCSSSASFLWNLPHYYYQATFTNPSSLATISTISLRHLKYVLSLVGISSHICFIVHFCRYLSWNNWLCSSGFQFLIGRLTSQVQVGGGRIAEEFQFLIGRLTSQTPEGKYAQIRAEFQFLIGRLTSKHS